MIHEFRNLTQDECTTMVMAPALVTLLIAGAEGNIDQKEIDWGSKIAHFRANDHSMLQNYYQEADKNFNETLKELIEKMPPDVSERNNKINQELSKLNNIFPKLDASFSKEIYRSLLSLSRHVAEASGGIWGYGSISPEEKKLMNLEYINPPGD
ncbi:MAG: hypothetical protein M3P82_04790 [Bacteroidota bacterium]|nr:hypothetical protein [Bacteroidota bacterium]